MRYPPDRRDAILALIRDWAAAGATRGDIVKRLEEMGMCKGYRFELTRDANKRYGLGWTIAVRSDLQEEVARGTSILRELAAAGKRRSEALRIVAEQFNRDYSTVDKWAKHSNILFGRKPAPVVSHVPPEARSLAARIERDLRSEHEPVVTPCEYPAEEGSGMAWGAAACWGEPLRIVLAHDYDDWRRQYAGEATERPAHVSRADGPSIDLARKPKHYLEEWEWQEAGD